MTHPALTSPATPRPAPAARGGGPTDPSHDEELRRGILRTAITRPVALALAASFLLIVYGVPVAQAVLEKLKGDDSMLLDLFRHAPTRASLKQYEEDLEKASYFKEAVQPQIQLALTGRGRAGNKRAMVARAGWLYYLPGVLAVAGPGFLDPDVVAARQKAALDDGDGVVHADPRPAVLGFHAALAARGIRLVLVPVPDKATLQPAELHGRVAGAVAPASNLDYARFVAELRAAGVIVFDAMPPTLAPGDPPRFLVQDTHWTPAFMQSTAQSLAALIAENIGFPPRTDPGPAWKTAPLAVERVGDIVDMLKLPEDQRLFLPQKLSLAQVVDERGQPWEPKPNADVLLLGDSFTNVFSLSTMGWGEAAGLAPQLALALGRDIDVIAQNDSGAFATRKTLSEALAAGEDRLAGKRVVIWELASRELAVGDWRPLPYAVGKTP
jgi:hypothetical protein